MRDETYDKTTLSVDLQFLAGWSTLRHRIERQSISIPHFQWKVVPSHRNPIPETSYQWGLQGIRTWYIFGSCTTFGRWRTLKVKLTICKSLLPVVVEIFLGFVRTSKMTAFCNQGIRKCVPSSTTSFLTPERRSKITARVPPRTSYIALPSASLTFDWTFEHQQVEWQLELPDVSHSQGCAPFAEGRSDEVWRFRPLQEEKYQSGLGTVGWRLQNVRWTSVRINYQYHPPDINFQSQSHNLQLYFVQLLEQSDSKLKSYVMLSIWLRA